nr:hypothetical protein [Bacteroidota bacterium]
MATTPTYLLPFAALCGMFSCTAAFIKINTINAVMFQVSGGGMDKVQRREEKRRDQTWFHFAIKKQAEARHYPGDIRIRTENISAVSVDGMCTRYIVLTNGLTTTPGKTSEFNRYAEGRGKIITGEDALPAHLFKNI